MRVRFVNICMLGLLAVVASNCNSATDIVPVQGVKVTPQSIQIAVGDTETVLATIAPANATDRALTWESSDTTIATVNGNGRIAAKAPGAAVFITAVTHDGRFQSSTNLTVNP